MPSGIQNNTVNVQIDVVLTKKGRRYKSEGNPLGIPTKFALSDDGVDYNQYDTNLPDKGLKITRTPMFDAWTNENNLMINKIITQPRDTQIISNFNVSQQVNILVNTVKAYKGLERISQPITITTDFPVPSGFYLTLSDTTYLILDGVDNVPVAPSPIDRPGDGIEENSLGRYQVIGDSTVNTQSKTYYIKGSSSPRFERTFNVVYGASRALGIGAGGGSPRLANIRIESIDTGLYRDVPVTITTG